MKLLFLKLYFAVVQQFNHNLGGKHTQRLKPMRT